MSTMDPKNINKVAGGLVATLMALLLFGAVGFLCISGLVWVYTGSDRCRTAWDAKFQPQYAFGQCSVMQKGLRVPIENVSFYGAENPEARD